VRGHGHRGRYEVGTCLGKWGFPLDRVWRGVCTETYMTRSSNVRAEERRSGVIARLYGRSQMGWRKVATGAAALLALAMGYHVIFGQNGLTAYQQKRQDAQSLDQELHRLQRENEALKGHVDRLQNDPNAIEHQAREELHYTRPGEVIYTLPARAGSSGATGAPASAKQ
jgi:cell division protein FtsB